MDIAREDVKKAARVLSTHRKTFQSKHIRQELGIPTNDKNAIARIHNTLKAMQREQEIEQVSEAQQTLPNRSTANCRRGHA